MSQSLITIEDSIEKILTTWPQTIPFFLKHHMICVGCQMSEFDTLGEALANYGIPPEPFLHALNEIIQRDDTERSD